MKEPREGHEQGRYTILLPLLPVLLLVLLLSLLLQLLQLLLLLLLQLGAGCCVATVYLVTVCREPLSLSRIRELLKYCTTCCSSLFAVNMCQVGKVILFRPDMS